MAGAAGRDREHYRSRVTMKGRARLRARGTLPRQRLQGAARAQPPGKERLTAAKPSAGLPELGRGGEGAGSRAETKTKHLDPIFPLQSTAPTVVTRGRRPHQTSEPTRHEDRGRRPPARRGRRLELGAGARDGDTPPPPRSAPAAKSTSLSPEATASTGSLQGGLGPSSAPSEQIFTPDSAHEGRAVSTWGHEFVFKYVFQDVKRNLFKKLNKLLSICTCL